MKHEESLYICSSLEASCVNGALFARVVLQEQGADMAVASGLMGTCNVLDADSAVASRCVERGDADNRSEQPELRDPEFGGYERP
jgi:hypothetical protein